MDATEHRDCERNEKTGHTTEVVNPITGEKVTSIGSLFVDDANLIIYGDRKKYKSTGEL